MRHHACEWCIEYFDSAERLHMHIWSKHHFECSICYDFFPTADELEDHEKKKHGGLQPDEQELQLLRCREEKQEKQEQSEQRKQKAKEKAEQKRYCACTECLKGFKSKKQLDNHTTNEHVFICGECLKIFHSKIERDNHMRKDHKGQPVELTDQEKRRNARRGCPKERRTNEPNRTGKNCGQHTRPTNSNRRLMMRGARRRQRQRKRPKPLMATTGMTMKTIIPQRMQVTGAAWTHCMSQVGRTLKMPTRKEMNKH